MKDINFFVGKMPTCKELLLNQSSFQIFSEESIDFLSDISNNLLKRSEVRDYPDVATFAFYCRRANINAIKKSYSTSSNIRIGRGIVFHITPGNVPVNFAYSLFVGLITGNINIVKVPSKIFEQVNIILRSINDVLNTKNYKYIFSNRLFIVKYDRDNDATSYFSNLCDVRIIWGGDNTIKEIRKSQIPPKSTEVTFSDRYSISVINASAYIKLENKKKLTQDFYNDTYLFDQNACTSPQAIYWIGSDDDVEKAQNEFWNLLQLLLDEKKYELQPVISIDKLTTFYSQAITYEDIKKENQQGNDILRINNSSIHSDIESHRCSSGYFNEFVIQSLDELIPIINRRYQTLSYFGISNEEFKSWVINSKPIGIDRFVPIGRTMDFSLVWDGFDLVNNLSRQVSII
ncbi:MAG: acyl-CoA reductase [Lutibacter sp.]|nr:acyl-CoA reductase [Lutibacter sp.]